MRPDPIPDAGTSNPAGSRAKKEIPEQRGATPVLGAYEVDKLPPESRQQWLEVMDLQKLGMLTARRYLPFRHDAGDREDVWQVALSAMWARLMDGRVDNLRAYVTSVCRNEALAQLKKFKARAEQFIGEDAGFFEERQPVFDSGTDMRIKQLLTCFRPELSQQEALVFILRTALQFTNKEVAFVLEITPDSASSSYRNAKKKFTRPKIRDTVARRLRPE